MPYKIKFYRAIFNPRERESFVFLITYSRYYFKCGVRTKLTLIFFLLLDEM